MDNETGNLQQWARRARLYRGRIWRSLPFVAHNPRKIMFMHMPKCAGTSLSNAMYATVPLYKRIGVIDANATRLAAGIITSGKIDRRIAHEDLNSPAAAFELRGKIALTHMCWGTQLIHGHVLWSDALFEHFGDKYDFVTLLRNPLDRAISNFQMNRARGIVAADTSIDQWLDGSLGFHHGSTFLRYFSGQARIDEQDAQKWLAVARANAGRFNLIGSIEEQSRFNDAFKANYNIGLSIPRYNVGKVSSDRLSQSQYEKLEHLCRFDIELYESFKDWGIRGV